MLQRMLPYRRRRRCPTALGGVNSGFKAEGEEEGLVAGSILHRINVGQGQGNVLSEMLLAG